MHSLIAALPPDSWFRKWMEVWPLSEPPKSYILCAAMSMLSATLGRSIWFEDDERKLWPMLNLLHIGPSGIGKSTSMESMAFRLIHGLASLDDLQIIKDAVTPEKLHSELARQPKTLLFASELAALFTKQRYMEAMLPMVTRLLDYPDELERRTKADDLVVIKEPSVTIMGASTREWLQDQMPDTATTGGFLARFFIVHEQTKGQFIPLGGRSRGRGFMRELMDRRRAVIADFGGLAADIKGEVDFKGYAAIDKFTLWYTNFKPSSGYLSPFSARAREFVLRLSMLFAISAKRNLMNASDVHAAITLYEYAMARLAEVVVPLTPKGRLLEGVLKVLSKGPLTGVDIKRAMRNQAGALEVERLLADHLSSQTVALADGRYRRK